MKIDFSIIEEKDRDLINALLQFESYDLCKVFKNDLNEHGRYNSDIKDAFINEGKSYIIRADGKIAGFMLIRKKIGLLSVEDFWIYPKYRQGLFAYRLLIEFSKIEEGLVEYLILKEDERWLNVLEYMIKKHPNHVEIIMKQDYQFTFESKLHDIKRYVVKLQK